VEIFWDDDLRRPDADHLLWCPTEDLEAGGRGIVDGGVGIDSADDIGTMLGQELKVDIGRPSHDGGIAASGRQGNSTLDRAAGALSIQAMRSG
jgi:hypothetical protein